MATPTTVPVGELVALAELVAGRRILDEGNIVPLNGVEWDQYWARLQRSEGIRKLLHEITTTGDKAALPSIRARARLEAGMALWNAGKKSEALVAFREAAELDPTDALARDWVAYVLLGTNDFVAALPVAEEAVRLDPGIAQAHWNLGRARSGTGDVQGAIAAFREAVRRNPQSLEYQQSLTAALKLRDERTP